MASQRRIELGERQGGIAPFGVFDRKLHAAQLGIAVQHEVDRGPRTRGDFLFDVRDLDCRRQIDVAAIGCELAANRGKQAGFSGAVGAGYADLVAAKDA